MGASRSVQAYKVDEAEFRRIGPPEHKPVAHEMHRRAPLPLEISDPDNPADNLAPETEQVALDDVNVIERDQLVEAHRPGRYVNGVSRVKESPSPYG